MEDLTKRLAYTQTQLEQTQEYIRRKLPEQDATALDLKTKSQKQTEISEYIKQQLEHTQEHLRGKIPEQDAAIAALNQQVIALKQQVDALQNLVIQLQSRNFVARNEVV